MLNKDLVVRTLMCYWSEQDGCFIAASPLFNRTAGQGDTPEEAIVSFRDSFDELYKIYEEGNLVGYSDPEGPATVNLNVQVPVGTRESLQDISEALGCSLAEAIDLVVGFSSIAVLPLRPEAAKENPLLETLIAACGTTP